MTREEAPALLEYSAAETGGKIGIITLNRPGALNAFSRALLQELRGLLDSLDRKTRVLIITGSGQAFSVGGDLKERSSMTPDELMELQRRTAEILDIVEELPCPVLAAVNGYALGSAFSLALSCDIRLAADHALLGFPETSLGIVPGAGGASRLARAVGPARARELIYTGRKVHAKEAFQLGLAQDVFKSDDLLAETLRLAREIARHAPGALSLAKENLNRFQDAEGKQAREREIESYQTALQTGEYREGLQAYLEKRSPVFSGE